MPGYDRTGPSGEGSMTGGQRGRCVSPEQRGRIDAAGYGARRGGRPYGGGRGRARGGGYGFRQGTYRDDPRMQPVYQAPPGQAPHNISDAIGGILDRLNELGETVAALYDRFESRPKEASDEEDQT